jgi:hypothetical protein
VTQRSGRTIDDADLSSRTLHGQDTAIGLVTFDPDVLAYYTIPADETLQQIAARFYGENRRALWWIIGQRNLIPDGDHPPVGMLIAIPTIGWRGYF